MSLKIVLVFSILSLSFSLDCNQFKKENIKLVTFDAYAALFETIPSVQGNIANALSQKLKKEAATAFANCWVDFYAEYMNVDPKKYKEPFEDYLKEGIPKCLKDGKLSIKLTDKDVESLLDAWTRLKPWPNTVEVLTQLSKKGYKLGILSNGSEKSLQALARNSLKGVKIDFYFGSTKPKCFKPKPEIYAQSLDSGFKLEQIVHVAGGKVDVKGARSYKMFTYFNQVVDKSKDPFPADLEPCRRLDGINDILKYL